MADPRGKVSVTDVLELPLLHQQEIPAEYLDEMGHMNVRWYVSLFSRGVRGFFDLVGVSVDHAAEPRTGTFALKQYIEYHAEVHAGQSVQIRSRIVGCTQKRLHLLHFMINNETQEVAALMEVLITHVDLVARRSSPFPSTIAAELGELLAEHERLTWEPPLSGAISVH